MDTTTAAVATGLTVTVGRWAQEKQLSMKVVIGTGGMAIFLALIAAENEKLASQFAVLILTGAVLIYGIDISNKITGKQPKAKQGMGNKP